MSDHNPYAPPTIGQSTSSPTLPLDIDPADKRKAQAVIKDANQFWLAIIICFLCFAIGSLIIPIWYLVRLVQWDRLAKKYPELVIPGAQEGSMQAKFVSSKWKLTVGIVVGVSMFVLMILYGIVLAIVDEGNPAQ